MAQSRTGNNKSKKSKVPMWAVAAIVVVVVAVAGYAIIRFSQAATNGLAYNYLSFRFGNAYCGGTKKSLSNGNVSCVLGKGQAASILWTAAGASTTLCANVDVKSSSKLRTRYVLLYESARYESPWKNYSVKKKSGYTQIKSGNTEVCVPEGTLSIVRPNSTNEYPYSWQMEVESLDSSVVVNSMYMLDPNPTPGWN